MTEIRGIALEFDPLTAYSQGSAARCAAHFYIESPRALQAEVGACVNLLESMQKISAYILAYNEAEKLEAAISSVLWADEIVVVDSGSTDRTVEIAQSLGARVV